MSASGTPELSDPEAAALSSLLDAFPSVPLETIAYAYAQTNGDPDLSAEIISLSINGIPSIPDVDRNSGVGSSGRGSNGAKCSIKANGCANVLRDEYVEVPACLNSDGRGSNGGTCTIQGSGRAKAVNDEFVEVSARHPGAIPSHLEEAAASNLPRSCDEPSGIHYANLNTTLLPVNVNLARTSNGSVTRSNINFPKNLSAKVNTGHQSIDGSTSNLAIGPSPPILEEFFPSSREKNAWAVPLSERLEKTAHAKEKSSLHPANVQDHQTSNLLLEFPSLEISVASKSPKVMKGRFHRTKAAGYACGLVSDVRKKNSEDYMCKERPLKDKPTSFERNTECGSKTVHLSESEAHILSILQDQVQIDIETVRDVLGNCGGDVAKSIEVLLEIGSTSVLNTNALDSDMESVRDGKDSNSLQVIGAELQDDSCMKWVVESLCGEYPLADKATVLEVLHANNFNYYDAKKFLEDGFLSNSTNCKEKLDYHESSSTRSGPGEMSKMILESFFSNHQDEREEMEEQSQSVKEKKKREVPEAVEKPEWSVVTRATVEIHSDEEVSEEMKWRRPSDSSTYGDWNDYDRHWSSALQHLKTMDHYLAAARKAYEVGDNSKGAVLEEKANVYRQLSREAKERANNQMLQREKQQHNDVDFIVDLREHNLSDGLRVLRLHIKSFSRIPSCSVFKVLTGCSKNNKSRNVNLRDEVVKYVEEKGYVWVETDPFCIQVRLKK